MLLKYRHYFAAVFRLVSRPEILHKLILAWSMRVVILCCSRSSHSKHTFACSSQSWRRNFRTGYLSILDTILRLVALFRTCLSHHHLGQKSLSFQMLRSRGMRRCGRGSVCGRVTRLGLIWLRFFRLWLSLGGLRWIWSWGSPMCLSGAVRWLFQVLLLCCLIFSCFWGFTYWRICWVLIPISRVWQEWGRLSRWRKYYLSQEKVHWLSPSPPNSSLYSSPSTASSSAVSPSGPVHLSMDSRMWH